MRMKRMIVALLLVAGPLLAKRNPSRRSRRHGSQTVNQISGLWQGGGPINDISQGLPKGELLLRGKI